MSFNTIRKVTEKGERALAIGKVASRDEQLILKAGEAGRDVTSQIAAVYNPNKEPVMQQNYGMIMDFKGYKARSIHGSIYRKESSPDYYDTKKISKGFSLLSQIVQPKALIDMHKKPARDLTSFVRHNNGALQNIKRENER
jgi:hypothetical protein